MLAPALCVGIGLHTGRRVKLAIRSAPAGHGVVFVRTDVTDRDNRVPVSAHAVQCSRLSTVISNAAGVTVSTIEHLMAALSALGVDNVLVELDGPELPILDGSALPFVQMLDQAGFRTQPLLQRRLEVLKPVRVEYENKSVVLSPCDRFEVFFEIDFASPVIGRQSIDLAITEASFRDELASARTFGFAAEVEALRRAGLALGGSLDNAVVIEGDRILNPEGLRMPGEFVRHKALDAVGDLFVLGCPILGRYEGRCSGHALNNAAVRALLADESAWRIETPAAVFARAG